MAYYERAILLVLGSVILAGFAALSATAFYGILWLFPSIEGSSFGALLVIPCLVVLAPGLLFGGGFIALAFASKKDLESEPPTQPLQSTSDARG